MQFTKYQHLEKIDREEVKGLCEGECFIFPKLDGTNGQIYLKNGIINCGSRNRVLAERNDDNQGFRNYITSKEQLPKYKAFFKDNPDLILYGEWLVKHTIGYYRDEAWRKFYIFDVGYMKDDSFKYMPYYYYKNLLIKYDLDFIPPLCIIENPRMDYLKKQLKNNTYLMKDGFIGEGIVVKRYDFINKFGRTTWGKLVRSEFKDEKTKFAETVIKQEKLIEEEIVEKYITQAVLEKEKAKIENFNNKDIPRFFGIIYYTFVTEDIWDVLKKYKNPKIDFKYLNTIIVRKCKKFLEL